MTDVRSLGPESRGGVGSSQLQETKKVAELSREFEAIFLEQMIRSMRATIPKDGILNAGNAEDVYQSMLDSEYAKSMTQQGSGIGLGAALQRQLGEMAESLSRKAYREVAAQALHGDAIRGTMIMDSK